MQIRATNFYGITNIAIQAKSKRINIINLGTNLAYTPADISSDIPKDILSAIIANSEISNKLSPESLALLQTAQKDENLFLLGINFSISGGIHSICKLLRLRLLNWIDE
ncbi:hypothetical protein [Spiroplasma endosymbiont of Seladonia tumulorum]|uniref:hypothetical protein n=1 Tax=Spiroplasma endosymbiont of Seladonia tumulorum TaxID=3066321 RepID=UPI0030CC099B